MNKQKLLKQIRESGVDITPTIKDLIYNIDKKLCIPRKTKAKLNYIPKKQLKTIHPDTEVAKELILIILSNFSSTLAESINAKNDKAKQKGYKRLDSSILQSQVDTSKSNRYKRILDLLIKNNIIVKGKNYSTVYHKCNQYKLFDKYFRVGVTDYIIQTEYVKRLYNRKASNNLTQVLSSEIGRNTLSNLEKVYMPSQEAVEEHLMSKVREGYKNKRGKRLVKRGKHTKKYDDKNYVFVEDYLEMYNYLKNFFNIPIITNKKAGHRVITKYNMMPSIIRDLLKLDNEDIVECDYGSLHPNIANRIYYGENKININHDDVANYLNISRKEAKIEHLSFFNKRIVDMKRSSLYKYYEDKHYTLLMNVENDKMRYDSHKITSQKLFSMEGRIMNDVVQTLNNRGISSIYVFDAIYCTKNNSKEVIQVMNDVAKSYKVKTSA